MYINSNILFFSSSIVQMDHLEHPKEATELPLKFEDIVDMTTYDKMRPPKPGGKSFSRILFGKMNCLFCYLTEN